MPNCINISEKCLGTKSDFITDNKQGDIICTVCGTVQQERIISETADWNNYSVEGGKTKNNSRCGWTDPHNPYDQCSTIIPPGFKTVVELPDGTTRTYDLARWHQRVIYNSKDKSFSIVAKEFSRMLERNHLPKKILNTCKHLWGVIMKDGKIKRGGNRKGMIACCVLYACLEAGVPRCRKEIAQIMDIEESEITKGEPLFRDALENSRYHTLLQTSLDPASMFARFVGKLHLPYSYVVECTKIHTQCAEDISFVAPKSIIAAIICYIIKHKQQLKKPTKKEISRVTGVCNPTMNKTVKYIIKFYEKKNCLVSSVTSTKRSSMN